MTSKMKILCGFDAIELISINSLCKTVQTIKITTTHAPNLFSELKHRLDLIFCTYNYEYISNCSKIVFLHFDFFTLKFVFLNHISTNIIDFPEIRVYSPKMEAAVKKIIKKYRKT